MGKELLQYHGVRKFRRLGRWVALEDTIISRKSRFAQYADNYNSEDQKLRITLFKRGTKDTPYGKFTALPENIMLEDFSVLSKVDPDESVYMEVNKDKVRLYEEVSNEN